MDDAKAFGKRLREVRIWRELNLREAGSLAGLSFSFWGQVERGEKAVTNRNTLEAMASALRIHPTELTGQSWIRQDVVSTEAHTGLKDIEIALERCRPVFAFRKPDRPGTREDVQQPHFGHRLKAAEQLCRERRHPRPAGRNTPVR